jgi:YD repeat-containing protein
LLTVKDPTGNVVHGNEYDEEGRVVGQRDALGHLTQILSSSTALTEAITNPRGYTTTYRYNEDGLLVEERNALGGVTTYEYDDNWNVYKVTDPLGRIAQSQFDKKGQLTEFTNPLGDKTRINRTESYSGKNLLLSRSLELTDVMGNKLTELVDYHRQLLTIKSPQGNTTTMKWSPNGSPLWSVDGEGSVTQYSHSRNGYLSGIQPIETVESSIIPSPLYQIERSADGKVLEEKLNGQGVRIEYDSYGRPVRQVDAEGKVSSVAYDTRGQIKTLKDQTGNETYFERDAQGRVVEEKDGRGKSILIEYDSNGNVKKKIDRLGRTTLYEYDELDRRVRETWVGPNGVENQIRTSYDAVGRVIEESDKEGFYRY